jgi:heme exporter protein C
VRWTLAIVACAALVGVALYYGIWWSPDDSGGGESARLLYLHIPAAVMTMVLFTLAAGASVAVLWRKRPAADQWARAATAASLILGTVMLASGMIWAKQAWSHYWDFKSPKLMLSLILWILLIVYFLLRSSLPAGRRRMIIAAAYCVIAYLDVPLIYLSTRLASGDNHPATVNALDVRPPGMAVSLPWAFAATAAVSILLVAAGLRFIRRHERQSEKTTLNPR